MQFLNYHYKNTIKYDLQNKFNYNNLDKLSKLKKIILSFKCKEIDMHKIATLLLALELITTQKSCIVAIKRTKNFIKLKKGYPAKCQVILRKSVMYDFLIKCLIEIFPKIQDFSNLQINLVSSNIIIYSFIKTAVNLTELNQGPIFKKLPKLDIKILTETNSINELKFLIKNFNLPIKKD